MKTLQFRTTQIDFQDICVHCLGYASKTFVFEKTFVFGRNSTALQIPAPLCHEHLKQAKAKSAAQIWCDRIGLAVSSIVGVAICALLLVHWSATDDGPLWLRVPLAVIVGISMLVTLWAITHFWVTPLFASAQTKTIINSLRITKFDPFRKILELTFSNDTAAELLRRANLDILAEDLTGTHRYRISAHILSHDVRLSATIKTVVPLNHAPDIKEAMELLQPAIDWIMIRNLGKDCFYDISDIVVTDISA